MIYNIIRNQRKNNEILLILGISNYHQHPSTGEYRATPANIAVIYSGPTLTENNIKDFLTRYTFEATDMKSEKDVVESIFEDELK